MLSYTHISILDVCSYASEPQLSVWGFLLVSVVA